MRVEDFINQNRDKIVDVHWNETIQQYVKNLSLSKVLLDELKDEEYFELFKDFFESINNDISTYIKKAINPNYEIAIVGAIKAGKSTLINALIGEDLASVSVTPETATLKKFKYSKENYIKVKFYTKEEWDKIWKNAKKKNATIFLEEYKELGSESIKDILIGRKEEYRKLLNISELKKEVEKWTSSQSKEHYFVKEIEIGLNSLNLPPQVCLVDTPGLNDIVDYRSKITRDYIDSANAILVCINARTLRNEEALTLAKVFSKARYKKEKIYILGTQIDSLNSLVEWEKQRKSWIKYLKDEEYFGSENLAKENILGISSLGYSVAKRNLNIDNISTLTQEDKRILSFFIDLDELFEIRLENNHNEKIRKTNELKEKIIKASNIEKLKDIINENLLKNFNSFLLKDFLEKYTSLKEEITSFKEKNYKILLEKKEEFSFSSSELEKNIENVKKNIKKLEEINNEMSNKIKEVKNEFKNNFLEIEDIYDKLAKKIDNINVEE